MLIFLVVVVKYKTLQVMQYFVKKNQDKKSSKSADT